ncbi:HEAT repeat domain-containing protein [Gimesia sp.]|uniref:HEAT repeat domain-containing protein n=1 Tax=Gimesia sp. TaxID=2024833 RepID=UPI003A900DBE
MPIPAWSLESLITTLFTGEKLPGEYCENPPWPSGLDDEYRRITAANCLDEDYGHLTQAVDALLRFAESGDVPEARMRCVTLLGLRRQIKPLIQQLLGDVEPELRLYAIEYLLVHEPERFPELEEQFHNEEDWQIQETFAIFRQGEPIPLFYYDMPKQ